MQGIMIEAYGGPEQLQLRSDLPIPTPGDKEVLVKVTCAGINFMDVHTRQGKYAQSRSYPVRLPIGLGMEGAGEIVALGSQVQDLCLGDRVAWCLSWGSYAQYACVPAQRIAKIPAAIPDDVAAASMFQGATAHYLIQDIAHLKPGDSCLIHAASGSIGQLLVQMAKRAGAYIYATASSQEKCAIALELGAQQAILYEDGYFAQRILDATAGNGVDVVFDPVGKQTLRDSFRACRTRGLIINYGNVSGSVTDLDPIELGENGSLFLTRPRLADHMNNRKTVQARANAVFGAILDGSLQIPIEGHYCLQDVPLIHQRLESRQQIGKSVVVLEH